MPEETKDTAKTTTTKATTTKATPAKEKEKDVYTTGLYESLKIPVGKDGDKRKTDLQGNPINF